MISFQHPEYWWAALALLIPLIILLLNKGLKNEIDFGSLSWLKEEEKSLHQKFQFKNILQWLIRTIVFTVILFMLLNPFWKENISIENTAMIVFDKSLTKETVQSIIDTIVVEKNKLVWNDFDLSEVSSSNKNNMNGINAKEIIALLANELKQPKSLTLIGKNDFFTFTDDTIQSNYPIHFQLVENKAAKNKQAYIKQNAKLQQVTLTKQKNDLQQIKKTDVADAKNAKVYDFSSRSILIVYDESSKVLNNQIVAALKSLEEYIKIELLIESESANTFDNFLANKESLNFDIAFWLYSNENNFYLNNIAKQIFIQNDGLNFKEIIQLNEKENLTNFEGLNKNEDLPFYIANLILGNSEIDNLLYENNESLHFPIVINELDEKDLAEIDNTIKHSMLFPLSILLLLLLFAERLLNFKMAND